MYVFTYVCVHLCEGTGAQLHMYVHMPVETRD